jgi:acetyl esterase/lipase
VGDSCGGNLVMSTVLNLKKNNLPIPLYQVLISPWVNLETEYASYTENEKLDPIITKDFVKYAASLYTDQENFSNPLVSPVHGTFVDVNPTLIMVGAKEILRDDSFYLHEVLQKSGCSSVLKVFDEVTHVWTLTSITSDDSKQALENILEFMSSTHKKEFA